MLLHILRLIEEIRELCDVTLSNDEVYMSPRCGVLKH